MKIYTKTGDAGLTGLFGGKRISKSDLRIESYGTLDELNAAIGLVISSFSSSHGIDSKVDHKIHHELDHQIGIKLRRIQAELFQLGAELATPSGKEVSIQLIQLSHIEAMEKEIDSMEASLKPLKNFILPGGSPSSASLHFARTISRRAERGIVALHQVEALRPLVLQYINRLSDYLFVLARFANHLEGREDLPWLSS